MKLEQETEYEVQRGLNQHLSFSNSGQLLLCRITYPNSTLAPPTPGLVSCLALKLVQFHLSSPSDSLSTVSSVALDPDQASNLSYSPPS